jgi:plastocyanin
MYEKPGSMYEKPGSILVAVALAIVAAPAMAQEVHEVQMVASGKGEYRFDPASVEARRGDVLLFRSVSGGPHSVVFDSKGVSGPDRERLSEAMPRRAGELSSPLLTDGSDYRVVIPALSAGTYHFYCLPHKAYDMKGQVTVR